MRQLADQQVAADGQVQQGGGDVDGVDRLVDERADLPGADAVGHLERRVARAERAGRCPRAWGSGRPPRPPEASSYQVQPDQAERRDAGGDRGGQGASEKARVERPAPHDLLVGRHVPAGKRTMTWTTSPAPRGPSLNVGTGFSCVPPEYHP